MGLPKQLKKFAEGQAKLLRLRFSPWIRQINALKLAAREKDRRISENEEKITSLQNQLEASQSRAEDLSRTKQSLGEQLANVTDMASKLQKEIAVLKEKQSTGERSSKEHLEVEELTLEALLNRGNQRLSLSTTQGASPSQNKSGEPSAVGNTTVGSTSDSVSTQAVVVPGSTFRPPIGTTNYVASLKVTKKHPVQLQTPSTSSSTLQMNSGAANVNVSYQAGGLLVPVSSFRPPIVATNYGAKENPVQMQTPSTSTSTGRTETPSAVSVIVPTQMAALPGTSFSQPIASTANLTTTASYMKVGKKNPAPVPISSSSSSSLQVGNSVTTVSHRDPQWQKGAVVSSSMALAIPHGLVVNINNQELGYFSCTCGTTLGSKEAIKRHVNRSLSKGFVCKLCKRAIYGNSVFNKHLRMNHGLTLEKPSPIGCNICSIPFESKAEYYRHRRDVHYRPSQAPFGGELPQPTSTRAFLTNVDEESCDEEEDPRNALQ